MAATKEKHNTLLEYSKMKLEDISQTIEDGEAEDIQLAYTRVCTIISDLDTSIDATAKQMLDNEILLETIKQWTVEAKQQVKEFREMRAKVKRVLGQNREQDDEIQTQREVERQRALNEENKRARLQQEKEIEEARIRQQQQEEAWLVKKLELEKQAKATDVSGDASNPKLQQAVKLQRYTITHFHGDYKDWIRFWNQFNVEVDGAAISEISRFNFLLEMVEGQPREDILGLPHTIEGYTEAKRILQDKYGKDYKVHKALVKDIENLTSITNVHNLESIHSFYNKLSRTVRTLATMQKLDTAQSTVYTLMDKLGPVREIIAQNDDNWERWSLEELVESLRKYVDRNPLRSGEEIKHENNKHGNRDKLMFEQSQKQSRLYKCVWGTRYG